MGKVSLSIDGDDDDFLPFDIDEAREWDGPIYLATPYTNYRGGLDAAAELAEVASCWFVERGLWVFSPIVFSHNISKHGTLDPLDANQWNSVNEDWTNISGGLCVLRARGWDESDGVAVEIAKFQEQAKPLRYLSYPLPKI